MKALLALFVAAALVPGAAFGYGGSYTNLELQRTTSKKKTQPNGKPAAHARSSSGAMVSEFSGGTPASAGGGAAISGQTGTTASAAPSGTTGGALTGGLSSFGSGSLGCPKGTDKDPATGRCVSSPAATTQTTLAPKPGAAGAAGAGATGTAASAGTTATTGTAGYGNAAGYGSGSQINANNNATQAVKQ